MQQGSTPERSLNASAGDDQLALLTAILLNKKGQ
jgi:hypothetical protein